MAIAPSAPASTVNSSVQNNTGLLKWTTSLPLWWGTQREVVEELLGWREGCFQPLGISFPGLLKPDSGEGSLSSGTIPTPGSSRCLIFSSLCPAAGASQRGLPCPPCLSSPCSHFSHLLPSGRTLTRCSAHPALAPWPPLHACSVQAPSRLSNPRIELGSCTGPRAYLKLSA